MLFGGVFLYLGDARRLARSHGGPVRCNKKKHMKRFVMWTVLLASMAGAFSAMAPAFADPHGDRMKRDCASGARKC